MSLEDIKRKAAERIHGDARYILESGLRGLPNPERSFDLGKIDYVIDNVDVRLKRITEGIVALSIDALLPEVEKIVEASVRDKIRKSI